MGLGLHGGSRRATLVYAATLPEDSNCEEVNLEGETLYLCDGVLYRAIVHRDEVVYEIVPEPDQEFDRRRPSMSTAGSCT